MLAGSAASMPAKRQFNLRQRKLLAVLLVLLQCCLLSCRCALITHYSILMLLSSTGCGRFLIKSAAQAKKKQKTAMQDIVPCLQKIQLYNDLHTRPAELF